MKDAVIHELLRDLVGTAKVNGDTDSIINKIEERVADYERLIATKELKKITILIEQITNTGELAEALKALPSDTQINPFGSIDAKLVYDQENNIAYIDDDFSFLDED